jgi:hypothetical protein
MTELVLLADMHIVQDVYSDQRSPLQSFLPSHIILERADQGVFGNIIFQNHSISNTTVYKCYSIISVLNTTVLENYSIEYIEVFGNTVLQPDHKLEKKRQTNFSKTFYILIQPRLAAHRLAPTKTCYTSE